MFQNSENLFVLKFKCAKFQTKKKSRKNDLLSSGILKKKIPIFRKFCEFFSNFLKKISNVPKFRKFICPKDQVCEVSDKKKISKK